MSDFKRYEYFTTNGTAMVVPFVPIKKKSTDVYDYYRNTRLDILSNKYYEDPNFGWLILQANPELGSLEFNIPENTLLRIPFPLDATLNSYNNEIKKHNMLYGIE